MTSRFIIGLAVVGLLFGSADCKKKPANGEGGSAAAGQGQAAGAADAAGGGEKAPDAGQGWIDVKGADLAGHEIVDAATGAAVGKSSSIQSVVGVPAGTYNVTFGKTLWKGVVVKAGETTVLAPGSLNMKHAGLLGHEVVAADTGVVQGKLSAVTSSITLVPGRYNVMFGPLAWPVEVEAEKTATLDPGVFELVGAGVQGHKIYDAAGAVVGEVSNTGSSIPLPPGGYTIDLDGTKVPFTIDLGKPTTLKR